MKERRVKVREMSERREFIRFEIDQMIELSYDREKFVQASGIDLSEKGLQCTTSEYVEPYTKLYLMFQVPLESTTESVQCEGIVIRSLKSGKSYSTSVTFTNIDANDRKIIEEYSERILEPLFEKKRQQKKESS